MKNNSIFKKGVISTIIILLIGTSIIPITKSTADFELLYERELIEDSILVKTIYNPVEEINNWPYKALPRNFQRISKEIEPQLDLLHFPITIYVDDDNTEGPWDGTLEHPYQHIQDAINVSSDGNIIFVFNGIYYEKILVNRSVDLIGESRDNTIIDGNGSGDVVNITVNWVYISGFTIKNSVTYGNRVGIHINSEYNTITKNTITNLGKGIYLNGWSNNVITENIVMNNSYYGILNGNEIFWGPRSNNVVISGNIVSNNMRGIGHILSDDGIISGNILEDNTDWGIFLWESHHNVLEGNFVANTSGTDFGIGIHIFDICYNNLVWDNIVTRNARFGIYVDMGAFNIISENNVTDNGMGIKFVVSSCFNIVNDNCIADNLVGIYVSETCHSNRFYHNNLDHFRFNAYDYYSGVHYQNYWNDSYPSGGNYWSDYTGSDNYSGPNQNQPDSDGIGDVPYDNILGGTSQDFYPLMEPYCPFDNSVINVDTGERFSNIQGAINDVDTLDGHIIYVKSGTYHENVTINKSITLLGADKETTIIDGNASDDVVSIIADDVTISGFTLQNSGTNGFSACDSGIDIRSNYNTISRNRIINNWCGINFYQSSNNKIIDNMISANEHGFFSFSLVENNFISRNDIIDNGCYGIYFVNKSNYNTISFNMIENNSAGITFLDSSNNEILENAIINNNGSAVDLTVLCNYNLISNNVIAINRGNGIELPHSSYNTISGNTIIDNSGLGFFLYGSFNNSIMHNNIENNYYGLLLKASSENIIICNNISDNIVYGICLVPYIGYYSDFNIIYYNNFINNPTHAYDECSNTWDNGYPDGGNYWDDYTGFDNDGDGIGDIPYNISGGSNQDRYPLISLYGEKLTVKIISPRHNLYIMNHRIIPFFVTLIIGKIDIEVNASAHKEIDRVEFYIDDKLKYNDTAEPYNWTWDERAFFRHTIKVIVYDNIGNSANNEQLVRKFF